MTLSKKLLQLTGWRAAILWGAVATLALRVVLGLIMGITWLILRPYLLPNNQSAEYMGLNFYTSPLAQASLGVWLRWDAIHHLNLARQGYLHLSEAESVFYPLYAGLTRLTTSVTGGDYTLAGLLVTTMAAWGAFACLFWVAENAYGPETARWSVGVLAIYPTAFFLIAPFTEALFLALTLGAFIAAYKQRWWLAGILGALASLTRGPGMLTSAALAWIAWEQWRSQNSRTVWKTLSILAGLALPILGGIAFLSWRAWVGFPPIGEVTRHFSGLILIDPVRGFTSALIQWVRIHDLQTTLDFFSALFFITMTAILVTKRRWRKPEWLIYVGLNLLLFLSKESFTASSLQSTARYVLALFPIYIVLGDWISRSRQSTRFIYFTLSSTALLLLSTLYVLWVFIG